MSHIDQSEFNDGDLLGALLQQIAAAPGASPPPVINEETLALLAEGALSDDERDVVLRKLADAPETRQTLSLLLSLEQPSDKQPLQSPHSKPFRRRTVLATLTVASAAMFAGVFVWIQGTHSSIDEEHYVDAAIRQLGNGQFDETIQTVAAAHAAGFDAESLKTLEAQAHRQIPDTIALASLGRLSDFGFELGGIVAKGPQTSVLDGDVATAAKILESAGNQNLEVLLNRGHVRLSQGDADSALAEFQRTTEQYPENSLAWLGTGLAYYMLSDFQKSESAFRKSLELEGGSVASRWNLAMTLEELGKLPEATLLWKSLLQEESLTSEHTAIRQNIEELLPAQDSP